MAIIVETGDLSNPLADAYVDVDYVTAYFESRDTSSEWSCATLDTQEAAIRYASLFLETKFTFNGCLQDVTQPLSFPRTPFYDREGRLLAGEGVIPTAIKNATCELIKFHLKEDLFREVSTSDKRIISESVVDRSVTLKSNIESPSFSIVNRLLKDYISGGSNTVRLIRG